MSLCHTPTHTDTHMPFLLTYLELSRDRLAVTLCCPATSDLPESSKRADPWLTTEIQLPNQAGKQKRGEGGGDSKGGWAERKKIKLKVCHTVALHQACSSSIRLSPVLNSHLSCCFVSFAIIYIPLSTMLFLLVCIGFMMPAVRDKTQRRKRCSMVGCSECSRAS